MVLAIDKAGRRDIDEAGRRDIDEAGRRDIDEAGRRDIDEASACRTLKWGARGAEAKCRRTMMEMVT